MFVTARRIRWSARALAFCAMAALATSPRGHEAAVDSRLFGYAIEAADDQDDELMLSEIPVILLTNRAGPAVQPDWMQLETDPCGLLQRVHNSRSIVWQSAAKAEDENDSDDDPSDLGRALIAQWLSDHSELAVINDEIDKGCDGADPENAPFPPDFAMLVRSTPLAVLNHRDAPPRLV